MINILSINWNVDPILLHLGPLSIRYYSLCWVLCFVVSYILFQKMFKREGLSKDLLDKLTINYVVPLTFIGARFGHCLFYEPEYYLSHPLDIILPMRDGEFVGYAGLASHGAAFGILLALWLYARKYKLQIFKNKTATSGRAFVWLLDRIALAVPIAGACVRIGNLMNSEIYGHATNLPWGFVFVRAGETTAAHPTQLYEALAYIVLFLILYYMYFRKNVANRKPGLIFGIFLIGLFAARFFIEFLKNNQVDFENTMALNMGQWLSIPFVVAGIIFVIFSLKSEHKIVKDIKDENQKH